MHYICLIDNVYVYHNTEKQTKTEGEREKKRKKTGKTLQRYVAFAVNSPSIDDKWWTRPCLVNNEWHIWSTYNSKRNICISNTIQCSIGIWMLKMFRLQMDSSDYIAFKMLRFWMLSLQLIWKWALALLSNYIKLNCTPLSFPASFFMIFMILSGRLHLTLHANVCHLHFSVWLF